MDVLRTVVLPRLDGVRKSGAGFDAKCPAHDDHNPSLSLSVGREHPVVLHCQAGCDRDSILRAMGLTWTELCAPRDDRVKPEWTPRGPAVAVYDYVDEKGELLYQVCRTADKQFTQRRPDRTTKTGWAWRLGNIPRVIYRLPKVLQAATRGDVIYICEGEKDVQTLEQKHLTATCNPGGAGKWRPEYNRYFAEADVRIVADRDAPGQAHARDIAEALSGIATTIKILEPAAGKDATDHFAAGHKLTDFTVTWTSSVDDAKIDLAPDLWDFLAVQDEPYDWVVPNLLEHGDRLVWTGFEGLGKTLWTRQLAVTVAAGLHPFTFRSILPQSVLMIDCENSERQARRKFRPLAEQSILSMHRVPDGGLRLIHKPDGLDLLRTDDAAWLLERVTVHRPDLLIVGPFYRLHAANLNEELAARRTVAALDAARTVANCAVVVEAHAGHGEQGRSRSVRPVGSSLLLRWPEFGYGIAPATEESPCRDVLIKRWRGDRDERRWPPRMVWGRGWPWQPREV